MSLVVTGVRRWPMGVLVLAVVMACGDDASSGPDAGGGGADGGGRDGGDQDGGNDEAGDGGRDGGSSGGRDGGRNHGRDGGGGGRPPDAGRPTDGGGGVSSSEPDADVPPVDLCPDDPVKTAPGECGCGVADSDSDEDGTLDCNDGCAS